MTYHARSKTERLRRALREHGPMTAQELQAHTGIQSERIRPLLRHDMDMDRISLTYNRPDGRGTYALIDQQQVAIQRAIRLLQDSGYSVSVRRGRAA